MFDGCGCEGYDDVLVRFFLELVWYGSSFISALAEDGTARFVIDHLANYYSVYIWFTKKLLSGRQGRRSERQRNDGSVDRRLLFELHVPHTILSTV